MLGFFLKNLTVCLFLSVARAGVGVLIGGTDPQIRPFPFQSPPPPSSSSIRAMISSTCVSVTAQVFMKSPTMMVAPLTLKE